jgi:hypothetical protein
MGEAEKYIRGAQSRSVSIAGILLLCLGMLLTLVSAAVLASGGGSSMAIAAIPCLLVAVSGLATLRRWHGWRYYSGVLALLFAYAGLGSALMGVRDLLIEAVIPQEETLFYTRPGMAFWVPYTLAALALFGLGAFIIRANRREPLSPGQNSAEPAIVGGLFLLIGMGCWIGFVGAAASEKGPAIAGFSIAALIFTSIGVFLTFRLTGWTAVAAVLGWIAIIIGVFAMIVGTAEFLLSRLHPPSAFNTAMGGVLFLVRTSDTAKA